MHLDVHDLRNFYYRSTLGRAAQKSVRDALLRLWPEAQGQTVLGFGFAVPLLRPYLRDSRRVIGLMPGPQGVMPWPAGQPNVSVLCDETLWPIETGHVDKLILMPNRGGLWSRSDRTPFGFGRPYTLSQLETQLKKHQFAPDRHVTALYQPPSKRRFWRKTAAFWERAGSHLPVVLAGGVLMVEAGKRVQAPTGGLTEAVRRPLDVLDGLGKPAAGHGSARRAP
jgi:hypothetical protein